MEVKIILILLIIHLLGIIIIKPKVNTLSCGIFAWAGKSVKTFNKAKFDIQGLYNDSRGGDSCGVTTDGEIYYGIGISKHYSAFLHKQGYEAPLLIPTVIGHTRKSSSGTVNSNNAHPFGFGDYEKTFEFVGVHNGTLQNEDELAKNYNIETSVKSLNNFNINVWERNKIDSEILLEIIYKNKNFKVLSDYIGGAALLFTNTLEPNVLYAFKGASRFNSYDQGDGEDERPLYYYKESKNSLYISSLQESLEAIGGIANENLFSFSHNTVYKITDGNIFTAEKIEISRKNAHQRPFTYKKTYNVCGYEFGSKEKVKDLEWEDLRESAKNYNTGKKEKGVEKILEEESVRVYKSPIIFNKLRYSRNGHLISGAAIWVKDYGFHSLGDDLEKADIKINNIIGRAFDMEYGYFYEDGVEPDEFDTEIIYPFTIENKRTPPLFYFYEGIMLETRVDYYALSKKSRTFDIWDLSEMSKHPVIQLKEANGQARLYESILWKRSSFTGNICPLGSSKVYYIEQGTLTATLVKEKEEDNVFSAIALYNKNLKSETLFDIKESDEKLIQSKFVEFCELNNLEVSNSDEDEDEKIKINKEEVDTIKKSVDMLMSPIYLKIQESVTTLIEFKEQDFVEEIIELNEEYLTSLDEIIDKNYK